MRISGDRWWNIRHLSSSEQLVITVLDFVISVVFPWCKKDYVDGYAFVFNRIHVMNMHLFDFQCDGGFNKALHCHTEICIHTYIHTGQIKRGNKSILCLNFILIKTIFKSNTEICKNNVKIE